MKNQNQTASVQSKAAHTPGPWIAKQDLSSQFSRNHWTIEAASPHCAGRVQTICELNGPWNEGNYAANARLIASAPELLSALQIALATIERLAPSHRGFDSTRGTKDVICSAIAAAKGQP